MMEEGRAGQQHVLQVYDNNICCDDDIVVVMIYKVGQWLS